jgi:hypothetical protein
MAWTYYTYILVMGVAATSAVSIGPALITVVLATAALVFQVVYFAEAAVQWKTWAPSSVTTGLWASANERAEWAKVELLVAGHRTVIVSVAGCAPLLALMEATVASPDHDNGPHVLEFETPIGAYLGPAASTPVEIQQTIERIRTAEMVVRPASESLGDPISFWPEMTQALDGLEVVWKGRFYQVGRAKSAAAAPPL